MVDAFSAESFLPPNPKPHPPTAADLWREVEAYAREMGEIDLDLFIAALAASEGIPVEETGLPPEGTGPSADLGPLEPSPLESEPS